MTPLRDDVAAMLDVTIAGEDDHALREMLTDLLIPRADGLFISIEEALRHMQGEHDCRLEFTYISRAKRASLGLWCDETGEFLGVCALPAGTVAP